MNKERQLHSPQSGQSGPDRASPSFLFPPCSVCQTWRQVLFPAARCAPGAAPGWVRKGEQEGTWRCPAACTWSSATALWFQCLSQPAPPTAPAHSGLAAVT